MFEDVLKPVVEEKQKYGLAMQSPCSDSGLASLKKRVKDELKTELDEGYESFLLETNGLDHGGLVIYASETMPLAGFDDRTLEGIVDANLGFRDVELFREFLVYGTSGEVNYACRLTDREFVTIDAVSFDLFDTFSSFKEMLEGALSENE
jgi:hypothetical protein